MTAHHWPNSWRIGAPSSCCSKNWLPVGCLKHVSINTEKTREMLPGALVIDAATERERITSYFGGERSRYVVNYFENVSKERLAYLSIILSSSSLSRGRHIKSINRLSWCVFTTRTLYYYTRRARGDVNVIQGDPFPPAVVRRLLRVPKCLQMINFNKWRHLSSDTRSPQDAPCSLTQEQTKWKCNKRDLSPACYDSAPGGFANSRNAP